MATLRGGGGKKVLKMYYVVCDWSLKELKKKFKKIWDQNPPVQSRVNASKTVKQSHASVKELQTYNQIMACITETKVKIDYIIYKVSSICNKQTDSQT